MEMDIKAGRYLEHGEYDGNLYGTKIDSIHEVVNTGRTCILDVNPQVSVFPLNISRSHIFIFIIHLFAYLKVHLLGTLLSTFSMSAQMFFTHET